MDSKYEHIKKQLSQDEQAIPPGFDWGAMEAGVLEKMETLEQAEATKPSFFTTQRVIIGLSVAILLLLIPFLCRQQSGSLENSGPALAEKQEIQTKVDDGRPVEEKAKPPTDTEAQGSQASDQVYPTEVNTNRKNVQLSLRNAQEFTRIHKGSRTLPLNINDQPSSPTPSICW